MYALSIMPYLERPPNNSCYRNIIIINTVPDGPLRKNVVRIPVTPLSPFQSNQCTFEERCALGIVGPFSLRPSHCGGALTTVDDIPNLFSYLMENGYVIDTSITKMMQNSEITSTNKKLLCYITYKAPTPLTHIP